MSYRRSVAKTRNEYYSLLADGRFLLGVGAALAALSGVAWWADAPQQVRDIPFFAAVGFALWGGACLWAAPDALHRRGLIRNSQRGIRSNRDD